MNERIQTNSFDTLPEEDLMGLFQSTAPQPLRDAEEILQSADIQLHLARVPRRVFLRWGVSIVTALAVIAMVGVWLNTPPKQLWAQAADKAQQVSSLRCRYTALPLVNGKAVEDANMRLDGTIQWAKSGSLRQAVKNSNLDSLSVQPANEPGISIDHRTKSYRRTAAMKGAVPPLISIFERLASSRSEAKQDLGESEIEGRKVHGFEVETSTIDADFSGLGGVVRVWVDQETKRIARMQWNQMNMVHTVDHFVWNEPTGDWFSLKPPEGYANQTPVPANLEETTQHIITGLKAFAKYSNGDYPKVKFLYGDVTAAKLAELNGADKIIKTIFQPGRLLDDDARRLADKPEYQEYIKAVEGFARINGLERDNPDCAYYGIKVSSKDTDKVLFRWQLETGEYQVIFGDLSHRIATKEQLKTLETK